MLDAGDPLVFARERFRLPKTPSTSMETASAPSRPPPATLGKTVEKQWGNDLIASWTRHDWIDWPATVAAKLAPIVGAKPSELLIADSTSVCLFKLLGAAVRARPGRRTIVTQDGEFSDGPICRAGLG